MACRKPVGKAMRCACAPSPHECEEQDPSTLKVHGPAAATPAAAHFDCSICWDVCRDPVVTCCGHLFCWPCLYCWLHLHSLSKECPVCKANVEDQIIPLYGCGSTEHAENSVAMMFPNMQVPCHPSPNSRSDVLASTNAIIDNDGVEHSVRYETHTLTARHIAAAPAFLGFLASMFRCGMAALPRWACAGTSILIPRQSVRIQNEFILHWVFIFLASIASVFFIVC